MNDEDDGKSKKSIYDRVREINSAALGSLLSEINQSSFSKVADSFNNSDYLRSVRSAGLIWENNQLTDAPSALAKIELGYLDSLKLLAEYGRTHPISALSQDTGTLSSALRELSNNEAMRNQLGYFSQSVKEMTNLTKAYNFSFPVFDSGLFDSLLFKYMSSDIRSSYYVDDFDFSSKVVTGSASADRNYEYFEIDPAIDAEIVHELKRGGDLSRLSFKARQYLDKWWPIMLVVLDLMAHFITFDQYYDQKIAAAKNASEIRAVVKSMPVEHREMLEGQSVVIRESVILREKPDTQSKELGRMKMGTRLNVESVRGSWVYVSVDINGEDMKGWVYQQYTLKL